MDTIEHHDNVIFSPMFNKKFLLEILKLQKDIEAIKFKHQESTMDLSDICFKPLEGVPGDVFGNKTANGNCSINSIWAYWQDDEYAIDLNGTTDGDLNYLDHFLECTNNPSTNAQQDEDRFGIGCLSKWGGPVQPWYTLGGFIPGGQFHYYV